MVSSWSIGTGQRGNNNSLNGVPGPGQYNSDKKQKKQPPFWKFGTGQRSGMDLNKTPGPGAYQLRPQTAQGIQYSIASKAGPKNEALLVPGPGAYQPRPSSAYKGSPQYSIGGKYDIDYLYKNTNVGPGSYKSESSLKKTAPKFGMSQRDALYQTTKTPGPGQYGISDIKSKNGQVIGTGQRTNLYQTGSENIGPGQYDIKSQFDGQKGISITSKRIHNDLLEAQRVPGPGSYNPSKQQRQNAPSYKIGTALRGNLAQGDQKNPGPGSYCQNDKTNLASQIKFGTDVRRPLSGVINTPGPGQYEYRSKVIEGPKYSIKGSINVDPITREKINTPGPGQYQPLQSNKQRPTSAKIGTSTRPDFLKQRDTPGPGNYDNRMRKTGPSFGFGTSKRTEMARKEEPGPGNYNIPSTFADVPKYSQNSMIRKN